MVLDHWSNDAMVLMDRRGLLMSSTSKNHSKKIPSDQKKLVFFKNPQHKNIILNNWYSLFRILFPAMRSQDSGMLTTDYFDLSLDADGFI